MYKLLINLTIQKCCREVNFKQACELNNSIQEKIQYVCSPSLLNTTFQPYYCTSQEQNFQLLTTNEPVTGLQHYKYKGSSLNIVPALVMMSHTRALHCIETNLKQTLNNWKTLILISVILSLKFLTPFHVIYVS